MTRNGRDTASSVCRCARIGAAPRRWTSFSAGSPTTGSTGSTPGTLDTYEALLEENDQDLYLWVTGQGAAPAAFVSLVAEIAEHANTRARG